MHALPTAFGADVASSAFDDDDATWCEYERPRSCERWYREDIFGRDVGSRRVREKSCAREALHDEPVALCDCVAKALEKWTDCVLRGGPYPGCYTQERCRTMRSLPMHKHSTLNLDDYDACTVRPKCPANP